MRVSTSKSFTPAIRPRRCGDGPASGKIGGALTPPKATNSVGVSGTFKNGNPGCVLNLWVDSRPGGGQVYGDSFIRCHFGVKNGYHSGIDGYGVGTTILCQPGPSTYATSNPADRGPNMGGSSGVTYQTPNDYAANPVNAGKTQWNPDFDWSQVAHQVQTGKRLLPLLAPQHSHYQEAQQADTGK